MSGPKIGAWVGVVAGLVFVGLNAGGLPDPWPVALHAAGAIAALASAVVIARAPATDAGPPSRAAIRT